MILTRSEISIQLTYSPEEYNEFNLATAAFRREINNTLRGEISTLDDEDKKYFRTLNDEFIQTLDYIDSAMIVTRTETGFQLIFSVQEFDKFNLNIGYLRDDLIGFQEWYVSRGECKKSDALEASQDLIDIFFRLMGWVTNEF